MILAFLYGKKKVGVVHSGRQPALAAVLDGEPEKRPKKCRLGTLACLEAGRSMSVKAGKASKAASGNSVG